jgi:DNA adenine methylase
VQTIAERLQGVLIENLPAMDIIPKYDSPRTLFYVDPPYVPHTRSSLQHASGKKQYAHEMGDAEHRSLAIMLQACAGYVVISGYPSPLYDNELYFDWKRVERKAMTCHQEKTEVLWTKPALVR